MMIEFITKGLAAGLILILPGSLTTAQTGEKTEGAKIYFSRGLENKKSGNCEKAVEDFNKAIELNPREAGFYEERSKCLPVEEALEDLNKAIKLQPDFAEAYFGRGLLYYVKLEKGENSAVDLREKALSDFNKASDLNLKNPELYYIRGKLYFQYFKDTEKAFRDFDQTIELSPRNNEYLMVRAMHYRITGEYQKAISDCNAILKLKPRDFDAFAQRGLNYFSLGASQKAIADYTIALKINPAASWVFKWRAEVYREVGKTALAKADERRAEKLEDAENSTALVIGAAKTMPVEVSYMMPRTEEEFLNSYEFISKDKTGVLTIEYTGFQNYDESYRSTESARLNRAVEANPRAANVLVERGDFYLKTGDYEKALADYSAAIALDPNNLSAFNNRGIACVKIDNHERAIADFARASSIAPALTASRYNFARVLLKKGSFKLAANMLTSLIEKEPDEVKAYRLRAIAFRKLGKIAEAKADEQRAKTPR